MYSQENTRPFQVFINYGLLTGSICYTCTYGPNMFILTKDEVRGQYTHKRSIYHILIKGKVHNCYITYKCTCTCTVYVCCFKKQNSYNLIK